MNEFENCKVTESVMYKEAYNKAIDDAIELAKVRGYLIFKEYLIALKKRI